MERLGSILGLARVGTELSLSLTQIRLSQGCRGVKYGRGVAACTG